MSPEKWEAPPQSVFKLNFDGAEKGKLGQVGVGGVCRNEAGEIVGLF